MNLINDILFTIDIDIDTQILAALVGILSMVIARLLDWYFPSRHHRRLDEDQEDKEEEPKPRKKRVKAVTEDDNE